MCSFENLGWRNFQRANFSPALHTAHEVLQSVSLLSSDLRWLTRGLLQDYATLTVCLLVAYKVGLVHHCGRSYAGERRYVAMKRRSMRSFQRQTQSPSKAIPFHDATACLSPVLINANAVLCGA